MKNTLRCVLPIIVLCVAAFAAPAQNADTAVIEKFIAKQASEDSGEEYEAARTVMAGDLNHDGVFDVAVLFTIEGQNGTNNYIQYLAAFVRTKRGLVPSANTFVGGKGNRDIDLVSIKNNVIHLKTMSHRDDDPSSTPSKKGTARFVLVKHSLKELRPRR